MSRTTIDFGIDLGTTNSEIAVLRGTEVQIFKDNDGRENTPSAVWIDKKDKLYVGNRAKNRLENDSENAFCEFKLQMGTGAEYLFERSGRKMKPAELSAEILKALKDNVIGEEVPAAVITVPAAFESRQCDATNEAAKLAGLSASPLLQEPVAAALAYGFQNDSSNVFWLVYDFGGGTFDAAIIQVRDGIIQVVNHGGDNCLGGKLIDWAIVEELLIPALIKEHSLSDFSRGNVKWRSAIAKLKFNAEKAKIRLSREEKTEIEIDPLCLNDQGEPVTFEYDLHLQDLEKIAAPFIRRSVNICRKVMNEKRLGSANIEKILLVGGPTLTPCLREMLSDTDEGLGIPLENRVDPLTVVARGAAIFAGTQRLESVPEKPVDKNQYALQLEYEPISPDTEPLVAGKILFGEDKDFSGYTIEFLNSTLSPRWRSGKISLSPKGDFMCTLFTEKGKQNIFQIELRDPGSNQCETTPNSFPITVGISISEQPLIHSIGVAMANNETDRFFDKGTPLPARKRIVHRTAHSVQKGKDGDLIQIPVVEGENLRRADRNKLMGKLVIDAKDIQRDVPAGSEVEITLDIDQSRIIRTKAYIPILDEEFESILRYDHSTPDLNKLEKDVEDEKLRLTKVRKKANEINDLKALEILNKIDDENMEHEIETALAASKADRDAADKCKNRLLDLKSIIDEIEDALEWPGLLARAEESINDTRNIKEKYGNNTDNQRFSILEQEIGQAMESRDSDLLHRKIDEMDSLYFKILREQPGWWVGYLDYMEEKKDSMRDQGQADQLIHRGRKAIDTNDLSQLKAVVQQLISLLPVDQQQEASGYGGTTTR